MKAFICIILFASVMGDEWIKPVPLIEANSTVRHFDIYVDGNGYNHIALCIEKVNDIGDVSQELAYIKIDNYLNKKTIPITSGCRVVKIFGVNERRTLVIAFEGKRRLDMGVCNSTYKEGCYDIFTTYSTDFGERWSRAIQIRRNDQNDAVDRFNPHLGYIKPYNIMVLLYTMKPASLTSLRINFVKTKLDRPDFSGEMNVAASIDGKLLDLLVLNYDKTPECHVFFEDQGKVKHKFYIYDNPWIEAKEINTADERYTRILSTEKNLTSLVAIYTNGTHSFAKLSLDKGENWNISVKISDEYHKYATGILDIKSGNVYELTLLTTGFMNKKLSFKTVNLMDGKIETLASPFTNTSLYGIFMPQLIPSKKQGLPYKAFGHIWGNKTYPDIYVSEYSNSSQWT